MLFVITGYQFHDPGKYIILKNRKYVIFHFFGVASMKNSSSPKIVSDPLSGVHLPPKIPRPIRFEEKGEVPPTPTYNIAGYTMDYLVSNGI